MATERIRLSMTFGALAPRISEQLGAQGIAYKSERAAQAQRDADALTRLTVRGILTDAEVRRGRQRLVDWIGREVVRDGAAGGRRRR